MGSGKLLSPIPGRPPRGIHSTQGVDTYIFFLSAAQPTDQGVESVVLLLVVGGGGTVFVLLPHVQFFGV